MVGGVAGEAVLRVLEGAQHGGAVLVERLLVLLAGDADVGLVAAGAEQAPLHEADPRREGVPAVEQLGDLVGAEGAQTQKVHARVQHRRLHADLRVGRGQPALGGADGVYQNLP